MEKTENCIDEDFPPREASLYNLKNSKLTEEELNTWKQFVWRRPHEIFSGEYSLFEKGIHPDDIKQGCLGNCYFLSALSAMAEFPDQIK